MLRNTKNAYSFAYINFKNLKHNLKIIRSRVKRGTKILIPVKSNAYGCGIIPVSQFLEKEGVDYLGVAFPFEGLLLRKNKIKSPILIFSEIIFNDDYEMVIKKGLTPTVSTLKSLKKFNQLGNKYNKKVKVHINIDTGMGRIGVSYKDSIKFIQEFLKMKNIKLEGIYTHLSSADFDNKNFTLNQLKKFQEVIDHLTETGIKVPLIHVLNSAGIINFSQYSYSMIRPGIMFYGYFPDNRIKRNINIKPCMDFKSKILFVKGVDKNTPISYGHKYISKKKEVIASIGSGYGDGINRLLSNKGNVLYKDKFCKVTGRVCMDQIMINITNHKEHKVGDLVTVFGKDKNKTILLEDIADNIKSIPYEILCLIGPRVKRIYIK